MRLVIKVGAAAGQGAFVTGRTLCHVFASQGYQVFGYPEYPSLVRGGHNSYQIVVADEQVFTPLEESDVLLAVNQDAVKFHVDSVKTGGFVLSDESVNVERQDVTHIPLSLAEIIKQAGGNEKMRNMALISAALALCGVEVGILHKLIEETFAKKGEEIVEANKRVASIAYEKVEKAIELPPAKGSARKVATGNELIALGAVKGGLGFYAAYPMTPSTGVLHALIRDEEKHEIVVLQAEDEIAAANMAVGAGFAGARAMVGTSGGGFALMTETVSMVGLAETPVVFYIAQRVGPSTGMPTWTEQGDLFQILGAGQGEFPRIILAPGTGEQAVYQTAEALNLAEIFQVPVFLLSDKFLAESDYTYELDESRFKIERGKTITSDLGPLPEKTRFKRYSEEEDGVSPRPIPGVRGGEHVATSYVHWPDSFTTENFDQRVKQVQKRLRKLERMRSHSWAPDVYTKGSDRALVVWGSQLGPALEAAKRMPFDIIHFSWLYPLDKAKLLPLFERYENIYIAENNATGLFEHLVKMETGLEFDGAIRKFNGRPFFPYQILEGLDRVKKERVVYITKEKYDNYEYYAPWRY